ncbi:predicted protein [Botrytis cinerea T4]|uniref:Uncharacterized protein n=1 Tax=Botryotinia fuckeliana (strain T4) TaxID=999810 RepID=G2YCJ9_BOTF4|nr:predicted protein [Botrytis cinerea T4]
MKKNQTQEGQNEKARVGSRADHPSDPGTLGPPRSNLPSSPLSSSWSHPGNTPSLNEHAILQEQSSPLGHLLGNRILQSSPQSNISTNSQVIIARQRREIKHERKSIER